MAKKTKKLTPRGRTLRWLSSRRGTVEKPPGSNKGGEITKAQQKLGAWLVGLAWCGVWCANAALAGGVKMSQPWRWASVANIEDDARGRRNGFRGWTTDHRRVLRGDLAVIGRRGFHVETVREVQWWRGIVVTDGGNTSPGAGGSQSNGGGAYRRERPLSTIHGFALVDYPEK